MSLEANVNESKEYEIAFVAAAEDAGTAVERELAASGCAITGRGSLAALKLAYPIKKHASGFFGYYWFTAVPAEVKQLHDTLALQQNVLRFLITTPPVKVTVRENRIPRERGAQSKPAASEALKEAPVSVAHAPSAPSRAPEVLSNELLEKKLEEILK